MGLGRNLFELTPAELRQVRGAQIENEWPLARTQFTNYYLHAGGTLRADKPLGDEPPSGYSYDPKNPVPTISGNLSALAEMVPTEPGARPVQKLRNLAVPGAMHQAEYPGCFACKPPYLPLSTRRDVLSFQTAPLERDIEVTGPITVKLWASSSALDTDFTAKLLDIYPSSPDYPEDPWVPRTTVCSWRLHRRTARCEGDRGADVPPHRRALLPRAYGWLARSKDPK